MMVKRRGFALILAIAMLMSVLGGMAIAADPAAGEVGYVSLHTYASTTDDPSIIKVTHTVQAKIPAIPRKVVFVLDQSGSMSGNMVTSVAYPTATSRWTAMMQYALPAAIKEMWGPDTPLETRQNIQIAIVYFGTGAVTKTGTTGYLDYEQTSAAWTALGITPTNGAHDDLIAWSQAQTTFSGGTQIQTGLAAAYNILSSAPTLVADKKRKLQ